MSASSKFYSLVAKDLKGNEFPFSQLQGKVVLVVNVASKCGFTPQYKGLEELNKKYSSEGLQIIGFPCNQFGSQEPGGSEEIGQFCSRNYGVSFPIMEKTDVNGANESPVYGYLKSEKSGLLGIKSIKWNFEKFLVDRQGNVVDRFSSLTTPESMQKRIEEVLAGSK
ncbi:Peroxiredoxin HYR1 [Zancudomyces culisetae]|uniref:Glutathione peroxidase n=1 Tax=Zancudomyces culisetae TaxID=1213189 RepID=A0A1R1PM57_ZANCU|nr:Peroxiredoxin HYR1 [Zancudomyces culisetae]|eukprot:OMH82036.1 Peroxiredoxin HYR1 [Zancudomyces culisetae]